MVGTRITRINEIACVSGRPTPNGPEISPRIIDPRDVEILDVLGPTLQLLTPLGEGDDLPCVMRGVIPPGVIVPLHRHPEPETFFGISGEIEGFAQSAHGARWTCIKPGNVFHVPGGAQHAFRNFGREPAVSLVVSTSRLGRFFSEVGIPAGLAARPPFAAQVRRFLDVAARYGYWNATPEENAAIGLALPPAQRAR